MPISQEHTTGEKPVSWGSLIEQSKSIEIRETPDGRGLGVFATADIPSETLLFFEAAIVCGPDGFAGPQSAGCLSLPHYPIEKGGPGRFFVPGMRVQRKLDELLEKDRWTPDGRLIVAPTRWGEK
jgi:hypothetical protein